MIVIVKVDIQSILARLAITTSVGLCSPPKTDYKDAF
jgi:hypothetical protein